MRELADALVPIAFFIAIGIVFSRYFQYRHQENMAMIERGIAVAPKQPEKRRRSTIYMMLGLLCFFIGIAFIAGMLIVHYFYVDQAIIPALMLLGGGLAMMATYGVISKEERERESQERAGRIM